MSGVTELAGQVVFSPFMFKAADLAHDMESAELPVEDLLELGKTATKAKARFSETPKQNETAPKDEDILEDIKIDRMIPHLNRSHLTKREKRPNCELLRDFSDLQHENK